ncbi:MAG TPA: competence protein ComJ [Thermomicrobiales bacterium]
MDDSMLIAQFLDGLDYGRVEVCITGVTCSESLYWTDRHFHQGFAWREGNASFGAPDAYGTIQVHIRRGVNAPLRADTIRAIRVPFTIPASGAIEVTCGWGRPDSPPSYPIPAGEYALHYSIGHDPTLETAEDRAAYLRGFWCDLIFVPAEATTPAVIKADDLLSPKYPLLMHAEPIP